MENDKTFYEKFTTLTAMLNDEQTGLIADTGTFGCGVILLQALFWVLFIVVIILAVT